MSTQKSYYFSLGNSSDGPVGFCARINATSKEEALARLEKILPFQTSASTGEFQCGEYLEVYFNSDAITLESIDEEDEE